MERRRVSRVGLAVAITTGIVGGCGRPSHPSLPGTVAAYVNAWNGRQWAAMTALVEKPPPGLAARLAGYWSDLDVIAARATAAPPVQSGGTATVALTTDATIAGYGDLTLHGMLDLARVTGKWEVEWSPASVSVSLRPGDRFHVTHTWPHRAEVFGRDGAELAGIPALESLVGSVGPATAVEARSLGAPYEAGDAVGQGGLEAAYERQLAGTPATSITVVDTASAPVADLGSDPARPGTAVRTTLDPRVAAEAAAALSGEQKPAAIVVVQPSTGAVLAIANRSVPGDEDLALTSAEPPGSTFKVVTTAALLGRGVVPLEATTCPQTLDVGGVQFGNFEHETAASLTLAEAFAVSCNTAFAGLAVTRLTGAVLTQVAARFGIGTPVQMGLPAFGGVVPPATTAAQVAGTAIGQGEVAVSPLDLAEMVATVDSGTWHAPRLVIGTADDSVAPRPLPPTLDEELRSMMAGVVDNPAGTAHAAGLPAGTFGKTGTAEYAPGVHPAYHAWFAGFRGDLAFSVFVYGGGVGGAVAAPIAARLLDSLGSLGTGF